MAEAGEASVGPSVAVARGAAPRIPPWYLVYLLLGFVQNGVVTMALPLAARPGVEVGVLYGAYVLAGLAAPLLASWADRTGRHRGLLLAGLTVAATALLALSWSGALAWRVLAAAWAGLGVIAANVVGTMMVAGSTPRPLWDARLGQLQACVSAGQVAGLLAGGMLMPAHPTAAFLLAGGTVALAIPIAWRFAPVPDVVPRHHVPSRPVVGGELRVASPNRSFHHLGLLHLPTGVGAILKGPLGRFVLVWLLSYTMTNAIAVMFAPAVVHGFGVPSTLPAAAYAVGITLSLFLYKPVATYELGHGAWAVLRGGLVARGVIVIALLGLFWRGGAGTLWPVLVAFSLTQVVWPLLATSSNTLAVTLSPGSRAGGVGLLNAATSLAAALGSVIGGLLVQLAGYAALCLAGVLALWLAVLLTAGAGAPASPAADRP
jgi:MFS family permease